MDHGIVLIDKPPGPSSAQALGPLKRALGRGARVGHAGTLDPFASGLLLALVGDATRLSSLAMGLPKTYVATVRFGIGTTTLDPEGEVVATKDPGTPPASLGDAARAFVGEIEQMPPDFSALKVGGERAYRLARAGRPVRLEPRTVKVHSVEVREVRWPDAEIEIVSGGGFYVRSFARDLGRALGLPAHLAALRRSHIGPLAAADGVAPEEAGPAHVRAALVLVEAAGLPRIDLPAAEARAFAEGRPARAEAPGARVAVLFEGRLLGLGRRGGPGALLPEVVLAHARGALP
jgi:tRNA pseudouridine55 synthase